MCRDHWYAALKPDVERKRQPIGSKLIDHASESVRVIDREASDHDPGYSAIEHPPHLVEGPKPTRDLEVHTSSRGERDEQVVLARLASPRPVEIDQMCLGGAIVTERGERCRRIVGVGSLAGEIALREAYAAAANQVDRGEQDHDARNAARNRLPASEERSG